MRIEDLLNRGLLCIRINVPNLELAAKGTDQKMVLVDLVQVGRARLVVYLVTNCLASSLDINIHDQNLLVFEA